MTTPTSTPAHDPQEWLTLNEAAPEAKTSTATLRREIKRGALRHARIGGRKLIRIRRAWLHTWLETGGTPIEVRG